MTKWSRRHDIEVERPDYDSPLSTHRGGQVRICLCGKEVKYANESRCEDCVNVAMANCRDGKPNRINTDKYRGEDDDT